MRHLVQLFKKSSAVFLVAISGLSFSPLSNASVANPPVELRDFVQSIQTQRLFVSPLECFMVSKSVLLEMKSYDLTHGTRLFNESRALFIYDSTGDRLEAENTRRGSARWNFHVVVLYRGFVVDFHSGLERPTQVSEYIRQTFSDNPRENLQFLAYRAQDYVNGTSLNIEGVLMNQWDFVTEGAWMTDSHRKYVWIR